MDSVALPPSALPPNPRATDVVGVETAPRPTSPLDGPPFSEVLAGGARAFVRGATAAASALPGSPLMAVALRGGANPTILATPSVSSSPVGPLSTTPSLATGGPLGSALGGILPSAGGSVATGLGGTTPSGLSGTGAAADGSAAGTNDPGIASTLQQDAQMNLYYLQVQEQVNEQNRVYTALSNVIEVEHSTAKAAITNIHT